MDQPLHLFGEQGLIELTQIFKTHIPLFLRFTKHLPLLPMYFLAIPPLTPPKPMSKCLNVLTFAHANLTFAMSFNYICRQPQIFLALLIFGTLKRLCTCNFVESVTLPPKKIVVLFALTFCPEAPSCFPNISRIFDTSSTLARQKRRLSLANKR